MLIYKKMAGILADTTAIAKSKKNASQNFMFRGIDDVMNELHSSFAKHGVFLTTEVLEIIRDEVATKSGGTMQHQFQKLKFTFWTEDGSSVSSIVFGEAMDTGDKASNKCMSIALKYALLQVFLIPTEDMAEPDSESHQVASKVQNKQTEKQIQEQEMNHAAPYTGTDQQKRWLFAFFTLLRLGKEHSEFMKQMSNEIQGKIIRDIPDYIRPKAAEYLIQQLSNGVK